MAEEEQERYQVQASRQSLRAHYVASQRGQRFRSTGGFFIPVSTDKMKLTF